MRSTAVNHTRLTVHPNGFLPLHMATRDGSLNEVLKQLLAGIISVDRLTYTIDNHTPRLTALLIAIQEGHRLIAQVLLAFGADKYFSIRTAQRFNARLANDIKIGLKLDKDILLFVLLWVSKNDMQKKLFTKLFNLHANKFTQAEIDALESFAKNPNDQSCGLIGDNDKLDELLERYCEQNDFIKLYNLSSAASEAELKFAILRNNKKLAKFILIMHQSNIDLYQFTLKFHTETQQINPVLDIFWSLNGFLHVLVHRNMQRQEVSAQEKQILSDNMLIGANKIKNNLQYRNPNLLFQSSNLIKAKNNYSIFIEHADDHKNLDLIIQTHKLFNIYCELAQHLKFISAAQNNLLRIQPNALWTAILLFLKEADIENFSQVSRLAKHISTLKHNQQVTIWDLDKKIEVLLRFMDLMKQEVRSNVKWSKQQKRRLLSCVFYFGSSFIFIPLLIVSLIHCSETANLPVYYPDDQTLSTCYKALTSLSGYASAIFIDMCASYRAIKWYHNDIYYPTQNRLKVCYQTCLTEGKTDIDWSLVSFTSIFYLCIFNLAALLLIIPTRRNNLINNDNLKHYINQEIKDLTLSANLKTLLQNGYGTSEQQEIFGAWALNQNITLKQLWIAAYTEIRNLQLKKRRAMKIELIDDELKEPVLNTHLTILDDYKQNLQPSVSLVPASFFNSDSKQPVRSLDDEDDKEENDEKQHHVININAQDSNLRPH